MQLTQGEAAAIQASVMSDLMADCAASILTTQYVPPAVLAGRIETLSYARAHLDAAQSAMKETVECR